MDQAADTMLSSMDFPTAPIPIRAVHYAGTKVVRNGYVLAIQGPLAFDLSPSDDIDTERVGIGIVTGLPDPGVKGTGDANTFPIVHVLMARAAGAEQDDESKRMLRVLDPKIITTGVLLRLAEATAAGADPDEMMVVMHPRAFDVLRLWCEDMKKKLEEWSEPVTFDQIETLQINQVTVCPGVTEPDHLFEIRRKIE